MPRRPKLDYALLERELQELEASDPIVKAAAEKLYAETNRIVHSAAAERRIRADERAKVEQEIIAYLGKAAQEYADDGNDDAADVLGLEIGNLSGGEHRRGHG